MNPATAAATMPATSTPVSTGTPVSPVRSLRSSQITAPAVIGVAIRKLNRAASSRVRPAKRPALMLMPDRLIPGTSAIACAQPMPKAAPKPRRPSSFVWRPSRSAVQRMPAPITRVSATRSSWRTCSSKKSFRVTPTTTAGGRVTAMSHASLRSGSPRNERSRIVARPAGTRRVQSRQK